LPANEAPMVVDRGWHPSVKLVQNRTLKPCPDDPAGQAAIHADLINRDLKLKRTAMRHKENES
jgi:hypothetical protein